MEERYWIVEWGHKALQDPSAIVGFSLNVEITTENKLPEELTKHCQLGGKNVVRKIAFIPATPTYQAKYHVITRDGFSFDIDYDGPREMAAGSSVNVAFLLTIFGVGDVTVVGPIGTGRGASSLVPALRAMGLGMFLVKGDGTSVTLTVRDPDGGGSTLFCAKKLFRPEEEMLRQLEEATSDVVIMTGVKPNDLPAAEALFRSKASKRALMPHTDLLYSTTEELRKRFLNLMGQADVVQINNHEAGVLLGKEFPLDASRTEAEGFLRELLDMGAKKVIVTLGDRGAYLISDEGASFCSAYKPKQVVDTCGAGDVHFATFIYYKWFYRCPVSGTVLSDKMCLALAARIAGTKIGHIGPWSGIPDEAARAEILAEAHITHDRDDESCPVVKKDPS